MFSFTQSHIHLVRIHSPRYKGPVLNGTLHFQSCRLTMASACPLSPWDRRVSHLVMLGFRRVLTSAPLRSICALNAHWSELRSRLDPDSQSGVTSGKCGLRGRPRVFRVPFVTGPNSQLRDINSNCKKKSELRVYTLQFLWDKKSQLSFKLFYFVAETSFHKLEATSGELVFQVLMSSL